MSEKTTEPKLEIFYTIHKEPAPHLHSHLSRAEAVEEAAELDSEVFPSGQVVQLLYEEPFLHDIAKAAAQILLQHSKTANALRTPEGGCACGVCATLRKPVTDLAHSIVAQFKAGALTHLPAEKLQQLDRNVTRLDAITALEDHGTIDVAIADGAPGLFETLPKDLRDKVTQTLNRKVKVVASRPVGHQRAITSLIGREFEIYKYNPLTEQVSVLLADGEKELGKGPVILGPDEYVFADETR